jgi:hypothetical protein
MPAGGGPIDPGQLRIAERRLLTALRRHQRRSPLRPDLRVDTLVAELRASEPARTSGHRGRQQLTLTDADLRAVVDVLVSSGGLLRSGHRVRLSASEPPLEPIMSERVDRLLAELGSAGAAPPSVDGVAARLGIPGPLVVQLRASGRLIEVGPRIDYTREAWAAISHRLDALARKAQLSVQAVRDELGTSRRHAEAILRHWNRERSRQ